MSSVLIKLDKDGGLVLPPDYRRAIGLETGDAVILVLEKGSVRLIAPLQAVKRAQALVRKYVPRERALAEELIRERRAEVSHE